jgi:hypothetical protein
MKIEKNILEYYKESVLIKKLSFLYFNPENFYLRARNFFTLRGIARDCVEKAFIKVQLRAISRNSA